jgi:hypothetical protein
MLAHRDREHQVAGGPAIRARLPLALEADLLAVCHALRDLDLGLLAALHGERDGVAADRGQEIERGLRGDVRALARTPFTAEAAGRRAEAATAEHAAEQILEPAGAVGGTAASLAGRALAEQPAEDVLEAGTSAAGARREPGAGSHGADLVVLAAHLGVGQHRVRLADLLEARLGLGVARIGIRVVLTRQLAVRLLEIGVRHVLLDAQEGVEVLVEPVLTRHCRLLGPGPTARER